MLPKDVCVEEFKTVADIPNGDTVCVFQVIIKSQLEASERAGGNAIGLRAEDGPLFLLNVVLAWDDEADDARVKQLGRNIIDRTTDYGRAKVMAPGFKYMNYTGEFQDVIAGYGEENKAGLVGTAEKYDPDGVVQ